MRILTGAATALALVMAVPALAAAQFKVTVTDPVLAIPNNNDYKTELAAEGLGAYTADLATIQLTAKSKVKFEFWGSESGFNDGFKVGDGSTISVTEGGSGKLTWMARNLGTLVYDGGTDITDWFFTSVQGTPLAGIGHTAFGIFIPTGTQAGGSYFANSLFLGFDDQPLNFDDNHDDIIIKVTAVPEPASWAMLIAGFGLVGAASRRRRTVVSA
jgi:hypothetical protein